MQKNDNWTIIKQQLRLAVVGILFWLIGGVLSYFSYGNLYIYT